MRHAKKPEHILRLEKDDQVDPFPGLTELLKPEAITQQSKTALGMSGAKTVQEVIETLKKPKEYEILRALQESDKLIRNLVIEGSIAEESIFTQQVLSANAKILNR